YPFHHLGINSKTCKLHFLRNLCHFADTLRVATPGVLPPVAFGLLPVIYQLPLRINLKIKLTAEFLSPLEFPVRELLSLRVLPGAAPEREFPVPDSRLLLLVLQPLPVLQEGQFAPPAAGRDLPLLRFFLQ